MWSSSLQYPVSTGRKSREFYSINKATKLHLNFAKPQIPGVYILSRVWKNVLICCPLKLKHFFIMIIKKGGNRDWKTNLYCVVVFWSCQYFLLKI